MALPPILQVQKPTAAVRASQQQQSAASAYRGPSNPRPVYAPPIVTTARVHAAAGRAQIPYQHPQAPNPPVRRPTGKGTSLQRLALALTQMKPNQGVATGNATGAVVGETTGDIYNLARMFNPKTGEPALIQTKNLGMSPRVAPLPDTAPTPSDVVPLPNMQRKFRLRPTTGKMQPRLSPYSPPSPMAE